MVLDLPDSCEVISSMSICRFVCRSGVVAWPSSVDRVPLIFESIKVC